MSYLKGEHYYINLYDLHTIKECLTWERRILEENLPDYKSKKLSKKSQKQFKNFFIDFPLYYKKGERYKNKKQRIQEWMNRDRQLDEKYNNASEPRNIVCTCGGRMIATSKELYNFTDEPLRVLFFFECTKCDKRRGIFDTGEIFKSHEQLCPKCQYPVKTSISKEGKKTIWITKCIKCEYKNTEIDNYEEWEKQKVQEKKEDDELLKKYRAAYCLSEKEGQEYMEQTIRLTNVTDLMKEHDRKNADPAYQKAKNLKILTVLELEKLLSELLEKEKYIKLSFDKPEMNKYVIVPFTIQEADISRKENDSTNTLQKIIKASLVDTNWRLMSEGTTYRLGYVYGRLKGYEREEDLADLVRVL